MTSPPTANPTDLSSRATKSFQSSLGLTNCTSPLLPTGLVQVYNVSTSNALPTLTSLLPASSLNNSLASSSSSTVPKDITSPSVSPPSLKTKDKIVTGVMVPVGITTITLLGILTWRKYRKRDPDGDPVPHPEDTQPYLQQKAELEDEQRRIHELDARERRYEIEGDSSRHELAVREEPYRASSRQELRGSEHCQELEVTGQL